MKVEVDAFFLDFRLEIKILFTRLEACVECESHTVLACCRKFEIV